MPCACRFLEPLEDIPLDSVPETLAAMKSSVFLDITPCSPLKVNGGFLLVLFLDREDESEIFLSTVC
jgi:hypothetical protein